MRENANYDVIDVSTEAVGSILVKSLMCVGTLFLGSTLGGYTGGDGSFDALRHGLFWTVEIAVESMISVKGFILLPLIFGVFYFFLRYHISRWFLILPVILFWILSHDYISYVYQYYEQEGILHELE
jgi:hypothetical protein